MREYGYYWVLFKNLRGWEVVKWNCYYWEHGSRIRQDKDFKKIDERRIERNSLVSGAKVSEGVSNAMVH